MSAPSTASVPMVFPAQRGERASSVISPYHKAARVLIFLGLLAAPWPYGSVEPWAWVPLSAIVYLALLLWTRGCAQKGTLRIIWTPLYIPLLLFLLLGVVQFVAGLTLDATVTRDSLLQLTYDIVLFFLAGQLLSAQPENGKTLANFGFMATVCALLVSLFALVQFFTSANIRYIFWTVKTEGWAFGPYINHNHYGGLMEMLMPIGVAYILSRPSRDPRRVLLAFAMLVPLVSILFSGSRGAAVAVLAEGFIMGVIVVWKSPRRGSKRPALYAAAAMLVAGGAFLWLDSGSPAARLATLIRPNKYVETEIGDRIEVTRNALSILESHPLLGVGLGSFEYALPRHQTFASDVVWEHAHDDYVEALAETGLVGGLIIAVALFLFLRTSCRHLEGRLRHESGWIRVGAAVSCCGLLVHSFLDFNLHVPANAAWFIVCAAIAVHPRVSRGTVKRFIPGQEHRGPPPGIV